MSYILLTTPLILHADPVLPSHAVTRQYVDAKRLNVNASWFTTGMIGAARMPALTGDVSSVAGSGTISLNVNGVTAGTYTKVTVDATGRVTAGETLVSGDIASVSWTKIASGKPTTAAGYGITNLISLSGGTVSGNISSTAAPSAALHAVTKGYVDNAISGVVSSSLSTGDVVRKPLTIAPSGFLRCNGGAVSRTTYDALFSLIGTSYNKSYTPNSAGRPWCMQYDFNTLQSADITGWTTTTPLPSGVYFSQAVVTKNRVYLLGGYTTTVSSMVFTASINADGSLGTWSTGTPLPFAFMPEGAVLILNRIYLFSNSAYYTCIINSDGVLGNWSQPLSLPANISGGKIISTSSRIYIIGGIINGARVAAVHSAPINVDGTLSTWVTSTPIPEALYYHNCIVTFNRIYILGGSQPDGVQIARVYTAVINADGTLGTWSGGTALPISIQLANEIVTRNRVYLIAGQVGGGVSNLVYTASINPDGTLGAWTTSTSLPATVTYSQAIVTSSRVYLLGGLVNAAASSVVYSAPFLGGSNDYTSYSTQITTAVADFTLPDFSSLEDSGINYFIKT